MRVPFAVGTATATKRVVGAVVELLLDADDGRARGGALLQRAIGALEAGVDDRRIEDLVAVPVEPAEQTHRVILSRTLGRWLGNRALRAAAGGAIDAEAVGAKARELAVMGWVRPTGEIHAEGAPDAVEALMAFVGDAVRPRARASRATSSSRSAA